jgi:membrane-associated phospholipid phosphatase
MMHADRSRIFGPALAGAALGAMALSLVFADRPVATFMFQTMHDSRAPFAALGHIVDALEFAATLVLVWSFWVVARGQKFVPKGLIALRTCLALFVALGVKELLKLAFGRTWPETWTCGNPSFIRDGAFGFSPFHGGAGWSSFPSGHETLTCAVAACLWVLVPRLRPFCVLMVVLVALGLLVADYHWLSDIFAGGLIGSLVGVFVARLELPPVPAKT